MTTLLILTASYGQELETLGAGVIDFLLTNPKTANRTNATEAAALNVLGNLLSITAHRKHHMNVAKAGRSEIVINTNSGNQGTVYSDQQGNVYLLYNGTIYPISAGLVNQAKTVQPEIKNSTLPAYNWTELEREYRFEKEEILTEYILNESKVTIKEIAGSNDISEEEIFLKLIYCEGIGNIYAKICHEGAIVSKNEYPNELSRKLKKVFSNEVLIHSNALYERKLKKCCPLQNQGIYTLGNYNVVPYQRFINGQNCTVFINGILIKSDKFKHEIVTTYTCNWSKDFENDGLDLDDFQGIKRSFYKGERQLFVMGYTTEITGTWTMEIYEASSGKTVYKKTGTADKGGKVVTVEKEGDKLAVGMYIYNFTITADGQDKISKSEKFEIIEDTEKKYASPNTDQ
ncbi:MAG: hypothetical protein FVQ77_11675 [Cytophagales bacterium]|nr:hypothetical protein [Cytophagales bacterium]